MSVVKRVGKILKESSISPTKLASMLEISHTTVYDILDAKRSSVNSILLEKFMQAFPEVSPRWILTGQGAENEENISSVLIEKGIKKPLDPDIRDLILSLYEVNSGLFSQNQTQQRLLQRSLLA